jgi:23S rRNA pseudouridine2605 synthase
LVTFFSPEKESNKDLMPLERIQKILSSAGICSRREAEELILEGRVKVNGRVVTELGAKADIDSDVIKVGSRVIRPEGRKLYVLLNKPKGFISTLKDPQGRHTVVDLLGNLGRRVYPVGRLDYDSEGVLLLTNDGEFANAIMHPSREVDKTYEVKVDGVMTDADIARLQSGVRLKDGMTAPAKVKKLKLTRANSWVEITIHEGRKRQVRRMCEAVGHPVLKLRRTKIGPLGLTGVPAGQYRELTPREVKALEKAAGRER